MAGRAFDYLKASIMPDLYNMVTLEVTLHSECDSMETVCLPFLVFGHWAQIYTFCYFRMYWWSCTFRELPHVTVRQAIQWVLVFSPSGNYTFTNFICFILSSFSIFLYKFFHVAHDNTGSLCCDEEWDHACPVQHNHSLLRRGRALGTSFGSARSSSLTNGHCKVW